MSRRVRVELEAAASHDAGLETWDQASRGVHQVLVVAVLHASPPKEAADDHFFVVGAVDQAGAPRRVVERSGAGRRLALALLVQGPFVQVP
eukprot:CAMPEP_0173405024 /NCGR_PEP_ID=MMETSP1356-20130122/60851_1 /TAXON_ID=77927 ORGANISM="Hemiselmis virescens, Strain PCC157" /NCGR_SAMPLE_ID=MMETSP1356 /ASSEMBLY_ACC=CAM_ASM_000847 /LENGTH=90 /DNA_ID=CAMNT_0014365785 /DNA_START=177 /DNA_END=445 /DNA_ORIENTATION=+